MLMNQFSSILSAAGLHIHANHEKLFQRYIELILDWNKKTNLISRRDESRIVEHQLFESLACLLFVKLSPGERIIDVGSGAGFPAIPVSIMCPDSHFLLVESKRMKSLFLQEAVFQLNLNNVEVVHDRIEHLVLNKEYHNRFDVAMSRAVASLSVVYVWVEKLIRPGGYYLAWKGGDVKAEVEQLLRVRKGLSIEIAPMSVQLVPFEKNRIFVRVNKKMIE